MKITDKNKTQWKALYNSAATFRDFKPWTHFDDSYIFGVQDPVSDDIGWCVIMSDGEALYGLVVYVGDDGFERYEEMIDLFGTGEEINMVLNQKCLKVEFVNSDEIEDFDKETYKKLGLKYRGKNQYPLVRRNDPGLFPWPMEDDQAVFLTYCLDQSVNVVKQALEGKVRLSEMDDDELLVMVPTAGEGNDIEWKPDYIDIPEPDDTHMFIPDAFLVNRVKRELKKKDAVLFLSFQYLMTPVQEKKEDRPFFPRLALWVDGDSGLILENFIYPSGDNWKQFQNDFIEILSKIGHIPDSIGIDSTMGMELMELYGDELNIDLVYAPEHPLFEELQQSMGDFF